jgi:hypothetical protein
LSHIALLDNSFPFEVPTSTNMPLLPDEVNTHWTRLQIDDDVVIKEGNPNVYLLTKNIILE